MDYVRAGVLHELLQYGHDATFDDESSSAAIKLQTTLDEAEAMQADRDAGDSLERTFVAEIRDELSSVFDDELKAMLNREAAANEYAALTEISQAAGERDAAEFIVRQLELELSTAVMQSNDGKGPNPHSGNFNVAEIERNVKAARLRLKLASSRASRANKQQSDLRKHFGSVQLLCATSKAADGEWFFF